MDASWLYNQQVPPRDIEELDAVDGLTIPGLRQQVIEFARNLDNLGLYALRMVQAFTGKLIPDEIEIEVGRPASGA